MAKERDPAAVRIGQRIRQAREMGQYDTQTELNVELEKHGWSKGRLSNYETGYSIPHPDDVQLLAQLTNTSECWIMFGIGPISQARTIQAIRHQNLVYLVREARAAGELTELQLKLNMKQGTLQQYVDNPFKEIHNRMARSLERAIGVAKGWLDEQHIEWDPMYARFPEDLRQLLTIYSDMTPRGRRLLTELATTVREHDRFDAIEEVFHRRARAKKRR